MKSGRRVLIYLYSEICPFWFSLPRYRMKVLINWSILCFSILHILVLLLTTKNFNNKISWMNIQSRNNWVLISNILKCNPYNTITVSEAGQIKMQKTLGNWAECTAHSRRKMSRLFRASFLSLSFLPIGLEKMDFKYTCRILLLSMPVSFSPHSLLLFFESSGWQPVLLQSKDKSSCLSVHLSYIGKGQWESNRTEQDFSFQIKLSKKGP